MRELVHAAPSAWPYIVAVNNHILAGELYKALKSAKALIDYEKELIDRETPGTNLRAVSKPTVNPRELIKRNGPQLR